MTQVLENIFTHEHNPLAVAKQEYELAKEHRRMVLNLITWERQRYLEAMDREEAARARYFELKYR